MHRMLCDGNWNSRIPLDQMLAECRGMGGAAAGAGHDKPRGMTLAVRNQILDGFRRGVLPPDGIRCIFELLRHPTVVSGHAR